MTTRKDTDPKSKAPPGWDPPAKLNSELQAKIGQKLKEMHDDVIRQGVPSRFADLIAKLDDPKEQQK